LIICESWDWGIWELGNLGIGEFGNWGIWELIDLQIGQLVK
jgi:hypothetical protein